MQGRRKRAWITLGVSRIKFSQATWQLSAVINQTPGPQLLLLIWKGTKLHLYPHYRMRKLEGNRNLQVQLRYLVLLLAP